MIRQLKRRLESLEMAAKPALISTWLEFMEDQDHRKEPSPDFALFLEQLLEKLP